MPEKRINLINEVPSPQLKPNFKRNEEKKEKANKIFRALIFISAIIIFFFANTLFSSSNSLITNLGRLSFWEGVARLVAGKDKILKGELSDRINILILGMGGAEHEGPYLTDTIILAFLKPSTSQVGLLSLPRDLYVPIPGYGWRKINSANALGTVNANDGGALTSQTVEEILGLKIHYWIRVDFDVFEKLIDELGGIEVEVEKSFTDYQFPAANFGYQTINFEAGKQLMSGDRALKFVRSRHGTNQENSDFARSERQQKILFAIREKIKKENLLLQPQKLWRIYNILKDNISTNLDFSQGVRLAKLVSEIDSHNIINKVIGEGENGLVEAEINVDGAYILKPKSGNFKDLAKLAENIFEKPSAVGEKEKNDISNISSE